MQTTLNTVFNHKTHILIKNARQNNLKNISLQIPQRQLVIITGVSGSGKSSLAFDTLYAEGQRRYIESLSAYIRQFLGKINKPEVDYIKGLAPAIAIQQKVNTTNPRSTVGTSTEIYDYLKLLYARLGKTYSPVTGKEVKRHTVNDVFMFINTYENDTRVQILAPVIPHEGRNYKEELGIILQKGFPRIELEGNIIRIDELLAFINKEETQVEDIIVKAAGLKQKLLKQANILVDRVAVNKDDKDNEARIADSIQTAFFEGHGECIVEIFEPEGIKKVGFSNKFEADGISFEEPSVNFFTFNNPYGACRKCEGFGSVIGVDEDKVIPDKTLSIFEEAVACWRGAKMSEWKDDFSRWARKTDFPMHRSYYFLTDEEKKILWDGNKDVKGINDFFKYVESKQYKIQYRVMLARYKGKTICPDCGGTRLRKDTSYVKVQGKAISELVLMSVNELAKHLESFSKLPESERKISERIINEITNRVNFLQDVGLGYLDLNRASRTLSGGESQRIQLVTSLGSNLTGAMYILDEPSIGLHPRDTGKLIKVLKKLKQLKNSVIIVEHDEDIIRASDYIIDIGPFAGSLGGEIVFEGEVDELENSGRSLTKQYLSGEMKIPVPGKRRNFLSSILIEGACKHNLKDIDVEIPLNVMTVITGVSGSGKSTLVRDILFPALKDTELDSGKFYRNISGDRKRVKHVEYVDQNPIGRSSRSNPVTYLKAFDAIRELFASQRLSAIRGYTPSYFSFNMDGGRCDVCKGEGSITVEMQFMADISLICESCEGKRYKNEILEITYKEKNIADVLDMTVHDAMEFFSELPVIRNSLFPLAQVGLDYLKLGQSSANLSGGEAQRVKLAFFLGKGSSSEPVLFIFDEPTTGLHFHDIKQLLKAFDALIEKGHTILIIEHNLEMIKCADWIIDLGPEGGNDGGRVVFQGRPEDLIHVKESYTAMYLKEKL